MIHQGNLEFLDFALDLSSLEDLAQVFGLSEGSHPTRNRNEEPGSDNHFVIVCVLVYPKCRHLRFESIQCQLDGMGSRVPSILNDIADLQSIVHDEPRQPQTPLSIRFDGLGLHERARLRLEDITHLRHVQNVGRDL